jgi:hypothetical protein
LVALIENICRQSSGLNNGEQVLLPSSDRNIVIFIDEIDSILPSTSRSDDFFLPCCATSLQINEPKILNTTA